MNTLAPLPPITTCPGSSALSSMLPTTGAPTVEALSQDAAVLEDGALAIFKQYGWLIVAAVLVLALLFGRRRD